MRCTSLFVALGLCVVAVPCFAQQTIFNVPSADITEPSKFFFQHQSTVRAVNPGRSWVQTDALGYGVGFNTEADVTVTNISLPTGHNEVIGVGFKTALPLFSEEAKAEEFRATFGEFVPLAVRDHTVGSWTYAHLSGKIPSWETRVSVGASLGTKELFGERAKSAIVGIEQPINAKWLFQADWFSGHHDLAAVIPGLVYTMDNLSMVSFGYQFPNHSESGKQAAVFEYTTFF